jgi:hypothetical protein
MSPNPDTRVERIGAAYLEPGETILASCHVWRSEESRAPLFAARHRDIVAVTPIGLLIIATGWLTRRARRCVFHGRYAALTVTGTGRERGARARVRIERPGRRAMLLEFAPRSETRAVAAELLRAAGAESPDGRATNGSEVR